MLDRDRQRAEMAKIPIIYQANIDSAFEGVKSLFPFEYGGRTLELNNLTLGKFPDPFDKEAQKAHRLSGEKWSVPLQGEFTLKQDGKVLDKGNLRLMNIPVPTSEGTYIMSRGEYHPFFQPRLKPGVYTRKRSTGEAEAQFNLSTGSNFTMQYDPGKKLFSVRYKATRAPLYHVMNAIGVSDSEMRNAWGSDIFEANKAAPSRLKYLAKSAKVDVATEDQAKQVVKDVFRAMEISTPEVPEKTLGYRTKQVGGPLLLLASQKVRRVHLGDEEPDNRESPRFKWMMDPSAYVKERTQRSEIHQKLRRRMRRHDTVRGVFGSSAPLDVDVWKIFTSAGLSDRASQTNPVASIMAMNRASILGEGGIGSMNAITAEARGIHPNYLGIFDPVITPEGQKTGVSYPLASGVEIRDREAFLPLTNMKTGKFERVPFSQVVNKSLALSDEVELAKSGKRLIRAVKDGQVVEVSKDKLDYTIRPASTLSIPARLVPFFGAVSPNRAEMAGRFMTQARVIEHNEAPWVQTVIPSTDNSMEQFIGSALLSRKSPVDGVVSKMENGKIHIKGDDGSKNVVHTAYLFPLNDGHSFEHDRILVKPGDRVKAEQVVAESNAVRDGALALGTNAVVAYMSDGGNNFEDAITISSSFAKRLSVKTLVQKQYDSSDSEISEEKYHRVIAPITAEERGRLENGIAKVGTKVRKGDLIVAAVRTTSLSKEERLFARTKQDALRMQDASVYWDKDHEGVVTEVVNTKNGVYVGVTVDEPARVGDKLATRMANKGVIGRVLLDEEMPKTADGTRIEIMLNPHGVGSRMNSGQVYEAVVGKVAKRRGEPIAVPQFPSEELGDDPRKVQVKQHTRTYYVGPDKKPVKRLIQKYEYEHDFVDAVQKLLDEEGIEAQEEVFVGGKSYGKVLVGNSHILRLMQLSEDKKSIRGYGHPFFYSTDRSPVKGSEEIGEADVEAPQAIGRSMLEALLVHGATANIRDFMTYKADRDNSEVWTAIQEGRPLPPPTMPFVNRKFEAYLTGLGLSVDRSDDGVSLLPMTDEETRKLSNGELDKSTFFSAKTGKSKPGELFDEKITGGLDGEGWGHIELPEAYPNPMFIKPISALLGISQTDVVDVAAGRKFLHPGKRHFDADENQEDAVPMIRALRSVNVDKEIEEEKDVKRLKYLHALRKMDRSADVYMTKTVPVVPPIFRPVSPTGDGRPLYADLNILYSELISAATAMKDLQASNPELVNEQEGQQLRGKTYESIAMLYGMAGSTSHNHEAKGIVDQLHGPTSKYGFIQRNILRRRQDLSARAVIVPGPNLGIDEIGIPFRMALELYKPFVVRELGMTPLRSREMIEEHPDDPAVRVALDMVVAQRPIWAKRDPVLHKFGAMAFYPKILDNGDESNAVELHPLVTGGFNADHDGDQQLGAVFVAFKDELTRSQISTRLQLTDTWWRERMAARFDTLVHCTNDLDWYLVDLEEFPHGEFIRTKDGENGPIDFYDGSGMFVLAYDEPTGRVIPAEVSLYSVHKDREVVLIDLKSKRQIISDDDPRAVYALDPTTYTFQRYRPFQAIGKWVPRADRLEEVPADDLISSVPLGVDSPRLLPTVQLSRDLGWVIGAMIGDGWVTSSSGVEKNLSFSKVEENVRTRVGVEISALFLTAPHVGTQSLGAGEYGDTRERITVCSTELGAVFHRWIGKGAENKHLPPFYYWTPREFRLGLVEGLIDTDGSVSVGKAKSKNKPQTQVAYSSRSLRLVYEMQNLLRTLGVRSRITPSETPAGKDFWYLYLGVEDVMALDLQLTNSDKASVLASGDVPDMQSPSAAKSDLIPIAPALAQELQRLVGCTDPAMSSLYAVCSKAKRAHSLSRLSAVRLINLLDGKVKSPMWTMFKRIVENTRVLWDCVTGYQRTKIRKTGFDLTVPGYETFMRADGVILSNTMALYVPISPESVLEAKAAVPSRNIKDPATGKFIMAPTLDAATGLFLLTRVTDGEVKNSYPNTIEALTAYAAGTQVASDKIMLGGRETTVGRELLKSLLPPELQKHLDMGQAAWDKKEFGKFMQVLGAAQPGAYGKIMNKLMRRGYEHAYKAGFSFDLQDFATQSKIRDELFAEYDKRSKGMTQEQKNKLAMEITEKAGEMIVHDMNNPLIQMLVGSGKPGASNIQQMLMSPMFAPWDGKMIPIRTGFAQGMSSMDFWSVSPSARQGLVDKVSAVSLPGELTKQMVAIAIDQVVVNDDCKSDGSVLGVDEALDRRMARDIGGFRAGTMVTPDIIQELRKQGVKKVPIRSPLACREAHGVCATCYGETENGPAQLGDNVGLRAAQGLGERSTQLSLRNFHCHHPGTMVCVRSPKGVVEHTSMSSLFDRLPFDSFEYGGQEFKIPVGWEIYDGTGWTDLRKVGRHQKSDDMVVVRTKTGELVVQQGNHPMVVRRGRLVCSSCSQEYKSTSSFIGTSSCRGRYYVRCEACANVDTFAIDEWKGAIRSIEFASDVEVGMYVDRPELPNPRRWVPDLHGYVIGMFCAEGAVSLYNGTSTPIVSGTRRVDRIRRDHHGGEVRSSMICQDDSPLKDHVHKLLVQEGLTTGRAGKKKIELSPAGDMARKLVNLCGRYSNSIHLPWGFLGAPVSWRRDALAGLIDGDSTIKVGSNGGCDRVTYYTTSVSLAVQVQQLCRSLGFGARISTTPHRDLQTATAMLLQIDGTACNWETIPSLKVRGAERLNTLSEHALDTVVPVSKVGEFDYSGWVYDVTCVSGLFVASGILTHNTGGFNAEAPAKQLASFLRMPENMPNKASLAPKAGRVTEIRPAIDGLDVVISDGEKVSTSFVPRTRTVSVSVGDYVKPAQAVSDGAVDPREVLNITKDLPSAQQALVKSISGIYGRYGIQSKHVELLVRGLTNLARVDDPGSSNNLKGDFIPFYAAQAWNRENDGSLDVTPVLKGVTTLPQTRDEWASGMGYRNVRQLLGRAASLGEKARTHTLNPRASLLLDPTQFGKGRDKGGVTY